jgi:hypothetical protein
MNALDEGSAIGGRAMKGEKVIVALRRIQPCNK